MKRIARAALAALFIGAVPVMYAAAQSGIELGKGQNPQTIRRLLGKFFAAKAKAPLPYPMGCVGGHAEMYTRMAVRAALREPSGVQLHLWTVPESFRPVAHPQPGRQSDRCDYRVSTEGSSAPAHFIAAFFSRKGSRKDQIAYVKVWQEGSQEAALVTFPKGPRGYHPDIGFKSVPVDAQPGARP
ncbi:MAG TPA: hypothetical protein VFQ88_12425 [Nevskiaceae bacterium]|nr:hypothetical protein [Nevskiaceae bacterium]